LDEIGAGSRIIGVYDPIPSCEEGTRHDTVGRRMDIEKPALEMEVNDDSLDIATKAYEDYWYGNCDSATAVETPTPRGAMKAALEAYEEVRKWREKSKRKQ